MKILVDADACPKKVLEICCSLGERYAVPVWTVASFNHSIQSAHHIVVGGDSQETDLKILNSVCPGDVVITQDWGLAAAVLGRKAYCIGPGGKEYTDANIDFLLEERALKAKYRRGGGRTKGLGKRTAKDDQDFKIALEHRLAHLKTESP